MYMYMENVLNVIQTNQINKILDYCSFIICTLHVLLLALTMLVLLLYTCTVYMQHSLA